MFYFEVSANDMILGTWEAESEQQARDLCAQGCWSTRAKPKWLRSLRIPVSGWPGKYTPRKRRLQKRQKFQAD
jgi:hypothetical protein